MNWINVNHDLPTYTYYYLVFTNEIKGFIRISIFNHLDNTWQCEIDNKLIHVTHWMPLPSLPEEELKINPCPICSRSVDFCEDKIIPQGILEIYCRNCKLSISRIYTKYSNFETEEELIKRWNSLRQMS